MNENICERCQLDVEMDENGICEHQYAELRGRTIVLYNDCPRGGNSQ